MTAPTSRRLDSFDSVTRVAVSAVSDVMDLARSLEGRAPASIKSDTSPVTVADLAIQAVIAGRLASALPDVPLIAEENAASFRADPDLSKDVVQVVRQVVPAATVDQVAGWIGDGGPTAGSRFWTLDPIDGTKGFLHGRQYVIALALVVDGRVALSVVGCPRLSVVAGDEAASAARLSAPGGIALAGRGHGAWWSTNGEDTCHPLTVSTCVDLSVARVVQSFEGRHGDPEKCSRVLRSLGNELPPLLMDSQAKHVTVAAGSSDLLMRFPPQPGFHDAAWDQAAGSLLIEEAGGRVTDLTGQSLDFASGRRLFRNTGMIASNGLLHGAVLEALQRAP